MYNPRHEFLLRAQWHRKPEHGPPVGTATLASILFKIKSTITLWLNHAASQRKRQRGAHGVDVGFTE
jgi:hypothetical protein